MPTNWITEERAETKECPFLRGKSLEHEEKVCIGNSCMGWRWGHEDMQVKYVGLDVPETGHPDPMIWELVDRIPHDALVFHRIEPLGCCGMRNLK